MNAVYVIDAVRTPIGKYGGMLSSIRPDDLLAQTIKALLKRNPTIDPKAIEDVIAGAANQAGEDNRNVARMAALLAGLPTTVAGNTVNRLCASGLQAIMDSFRAIRSGEGDIYIACGVESMSRAPYVMSKPSEAFARQPQIFDTTLGWRFINPKLSELYNPYSMGETAENVAKQWNINREQQDIFAFESQNKYAQALANNYWKDEIVNVEIIKDKIPISFAQDEHPRQATLEKLALLKPAFALEGTVTAGNSSGINDGAAAMILASETAVKRYNLKPIAEVKASAVAGVDPSIMGVGPIPAVQKLLARANQSISQIDLFELNEAFASQSLACINDLGIDPTKVNVNGGAIALGHPLGCSGVRISTTLLHQMKRQNAGLGMATMCVGVGQGAAILFSNVAS
jgi:3-oxoadipyl-CoA thiolase